METYESAKEEIKRAADIVELIGRYVQLKKAGLNHIGLCPFHSEKAPSFTVSQSKQMFHCFGCKKGGDVFKFWMEYHKVAFPQALRDLAERYHIALPEKKITPAQKRQIELKDLLIKLNEAAAEFYHQILLNSDKGRPGRDYFRKRSLDGDTARAFKLGYAPDEWDGLVGYLKNRNMDLEKAAEAGLIIPKKNGGFYDRFRGRVIFPINNIRGQVTGFGGRVLDDSLPKYLNSPETPVFYKGELLYGLHSAYEDIRTNERAVIVEGYTDVLALRKHGLKESVATLGTALTKGHIRRLKGYAKEAIVVFDSDSAGKTAALKSMPLFMNEGLSSKVMVLPEGEDPDSFVNKRGLDTFLEHLDKSLPMFDFYIDLKSEKMGNGIEGQINLLEEIIPVLKKLDNESQQLLYVSRLTERTGISESVILAEMKKQRASGPGTYDIKSIRNRLSGNKAKRGDDIPLLNLLVHSPDMAIRLINSDCRILLSDPVVIEIFNFVQKTYPGGGDIENKRIQKELENEEARERFREAMLSSPIYPGDAVELAVKEFEMRINKIKRTKHINKARKKGDIEVLNQLLRSGDNNLRG